MSNRQYARTSQGIVRNVRQSIKPEANRAVPNRNASASNRSAVANKPASNTENNANNVRTDEAIKINKILNLLNDRLRVVEAKAENITNTETSVNFEENINLTKLNTLFSLMNSRISTLEKHYEMENLNTNLEKALNGNIDEESDKPETNSVSEVFTNKVNEMITNSEKINNIENNVTDLTKSVNNININGITNNFMKLNNLIQTIKKDLTNEIETLKTSVAQKQAQTEIVNDKNIIIGEQPKEEQPKEEQPKEEQPKEEQPKEEGVKGGHLPLEQPKEEQPNEEGVKPMVSDTKEEPLPLDEKENIKISLEEEKA